jgi:hypothetical protein
VTDVGELIPETRIRREAESLENLLKTKQKINTLEDFHKWLYTKHKAYSYGAELKKVQGNVLQSY